MYPHVPGPCNVIRRFPILGNRTAVPQSVNPIVIFVTVPNEFRTTLRTRTFFAFKSLHTTRAAFNSSNPSATCKNTSNLTRSLRSRPSARSRTIKSSKHPSSHNSLTTARYFFPSDGFVVAAHPCVFTATRGRSLTVATSATTADSLFESTTRAHTFSPRNRARYAVANPPSPNTRA